MTGLTPDEFAAIISHEFAHVRRYDLWVNLLQRIIESLLFFHPVVWFVSRRLSTEREICCDDLVVRAGCAPMNYAGALLRMAELCATTGQLNMATLAATGGKPSLLEHRSERLMNVQKAPHMQLTRVGVLALMLTQAVDLHPTPEKQYVEVSLGHSKELNKTVEVNLTRETEVEFTLPETPPKAARDEKASAKADEVEIKSPRCINVENLKARPLAEAIAAFNHEVKESPIGLMPQPIIIQETLDAM